MTPEPIEPDTKDWTWVLTRRCPDCDFDAAFDHISTLLPKELPA